MKIFLFSHFLKIVYLDWWPVTRDSLMYAVSVIALIVTIRDGRIMWYEALILILMYFIYIAGREYFHRLFCC